MNFFSVIGSHALPTRKRRWPLGLVFLAGILAVSGCAVQYYDPATGMAHLWGIGHLRMKVTPPAEGVRAVVIGADTLGLSFGALASERRLILGWERFSHIHILGADTALRIEWPSSDLFTVRIGSELPSGNQ